MEKFVKTALWACVGLTVTNYVQNWAGILLGALCTLMSIKEIRELSKEK